MSGISASLAGRVGVVKMLGLSSREINGIAFSKPFIPTKEFMQERLAYRKVFDFDTLVNEIHTGSFPEICTRNRENADSFQSYLDWNDYYSSYFQTYIEKDIKDILNIQDELAFIKFVRATASLTGQLLNFSTIAKICEKDINTIKRWLSILVSSGLVYILEPYYNNLNKRLIKAPKIYFLDTGLACFLLGWNTPEQMIRGSMWGNIFETYVVGEILKSYYNTGIFHPQIYFYRDKEQNEIDLIIENGDYLHPIEIKTTSDPQKQMIKSFEKLKTFTNKKIGSGALICLSKDILPLNSNTIILPVDTI